MTEAEIKNILWGVYELSKTADNPEYGNSYKARCLNQSSRLNAINHGAKTRLREMGEEIREEANAVETDPNQLDLFGE